MQGCMIFIFKSNDLKSNHTALILVRIKPPEN
jgi:hypothetical protein